jgi:hypothetical protein
MLVFAVAVAATYVTGRGAMLESFVANAIQGLVGFVQVVIPG